jgi:gliding motility-associated-like protein
MLKPYNSFIYYLQNIKILTAAFALMQSFAFADQFAYENSKKQKLAPKKENYTSFNASRIALDINQWKSYNHEKDFFHPEFGKMPFNAPDRELVEVLNKRGVDYRYFVNPYQPSEFFVQQSLGDLHYFKDGLWQTIDHHLNNNGNGLYEANQQPEPVGFNAINKVSYINTVFGKVNFNQWKLYGINNDDDEIFVASADWSDHTAGDDGIYINDIFPGIDASMKVSRGAIKTNFIIKSVVNYSFKELIFTDEFNFGDGASILQFMNVSNHNRAADRVQLLTANKPIIEIGEAVAYIENGQKDQRYFPEYQLLKNKLGIIIPVNWLQQSLQSGHVIIDPLVTSSNTLAQAAITGSRYDATCNFTQSCDFTLNVNTPAAAVFTDVLVNFDYLAQGFCFMEDGATRFTLGGCTSPNTAGFYWFCAPPAGSAPGTCTGANISIYPDISGCLPAPSCVAQNLTFGLKFYRSCWGTTGAACSNTCIGAASPWNVVIQGQTVGFTNPAPNQFSVSSTSVCAGQNITATSLGSQFGLAPYNVNWSLSPTGVPSVGSGSPAVINFPTAGAYTLYCIVTDACGSTSSASKAITITAPPAAPTVVSPILYCQNSSASILTATGLNLEWFTVPVGGTPTGAPTPSTGLPGTTSYYVQQTVGGCVGPRAQINVIVNPLPTFSGSVTSIPASCGGSDGSVSGLTANGIGTINYDWYNSASVLVSSSTSNADLSNQPAGDYNLTVTDANGCSATYGPVVISSASPPSAPTVVTPISYCIGATATALTAVGLNLLWYNVPVGGVGDPNAPIPSTASPGAISYYVSQTVNGCESSRSQIDVIINNAPVAPTVTNPINYCQGATSTPLTATGSALLWYTAPPPGVGNPVAPTPSTAVAGIVNYYVSQTVAGCESNTAQITVQVIDPPSIIGPPVVTPSTCGASDGSITGLTITGNGSLTYSWSNASAVVVFTSTTSSSLLNQPSGTYTLTVTDVTGCVSVSAPIQINNNAAPNPPVVVTPIQYCTGAIPAPLSAIGNSLLWYTIPSGGIGSSTAPTPSTAVVGTVSYYVSQTVSGCESALAQIDIVVSAPPSAPLVTSPVNYCLNGTATPLTAAGNNLLWYTVSSGGTGSSVAPVPSTAAIGTTSYYVSQSNNGCESALAQIDVVINSLPAIPTVVSPISYCQGASASPLTATGSSLLWYTSSSGGTGLATLTPQTNIPGSTSYYVTQTIGACESPLAEIVVIINPDVVPTAIITSSSTNVCAGTLISFSAIVNNAGANPGLQWMLNGNPITGETNLNFSSNTLPPNSVITFQVTSTAACANPTQITSNSIPLDIIPNVTPSVSIISDPATVCTGQPVTIIATAVYGGTSPIYDFRVNGISEQNGNLNAYTSNSFQDGDVVVVVMNSNYQCISGSNTVTSNAINIDIAAPPEINAVAAEDTIIRGQSTKLTAETNSLNAIYLWEPGSSLLCAVCETTTASPDTATIYYLTITDYITGCVNYDTVFVFVSTEFNVFVPTAFSPNLDGFNDELFVRGTGIKDFTLDVFDRWGTRLFTGSDPKKGWDGTLNDKPVMAGVYTYYLKYQKYDGEFGELKGNITLVR